MFSFSITRTARIFWLISWWVVQQREHFRALSPFLDEVNLSSRFLMVNPWGRLSCYLKTP